MTEFTKKVNSSNIGPEAIDGMVIRDIKYKRDARSRQIAAIIIGVFLMILIFFNILILKQNLEMNNKIINLILDAIPKQAP